MSAPTSPPSGGSVPDPYSTPDAGSATEPYAPQAPYGQPAPQTAAPYAEATTSPYGGQPPYAYTPARKTDGVSIAALVTGILGLALIPLGLGIAGVVRTKSPARSGRGLAIAGIVLGALSTIAWAVVVGLVVMVATNDEAQAAFTESFQESYQESFQEGRGLAYDAGECFDFPADAVSVSEITPADCATPHTTEVVGVHQLEGGDFPGDDGVEQAFADLCVPPFESYVGSSVAETSLILYYVGPDATSWALGDRQLLCTVDSGDGSPLEGTIQGSGR